MDEQRQDDQLEPIYNSTVLILHVAWNTSQERWTIETGGERVSGRSVLAAWHDDGDDDDDKTKKHKKHFLNLWFIKITFFGHYHSCTDSQDSSYQRMEVDWR